MTLVTFLIFLYSLTKNLPNQTIPIQSKGISALGLDRELGFSRGHQECQGHRPHDDDPPPPLKAHCAKIKIQISQLWDLIETGDFR